MIMYLVLFLSIIFVVLVFVLFAKYIDWGHYLEHTDKSKNDYIFASYKSFVFRFEKAKLTAENRKSYCTFKDNNGNYISLNIITFNNINLILGFFDYLRAVRYIKKAESKAAL